MAQGCSQLYGAAVERLLAEYDIAVAKTDSLKDAPKSQWCAAKRYENDLFDSYNKARLKAQTCMCQNGFCDSMEEHSRNVANAAKTRLRTEKYCD